MRRRAAQTSGSRYSNQSAALKDRQCDVAAEKALTELESGLAELRQLLENLKRQIWASHFHEEELNLQLRARKNFVLVEEEMPQHEQQS